MYKKRQLVQIVFMSRESIGIYLGFITVNGIVLHRVYNLKRKMVTFYTCDEIKPIRRKNEL
jgi:hypothetical protein